MGISIIIVSYNVRHVLPACLNSILHSSKNFPHKVEITVVDNHSRDETVFQLKSSFSKVNWIELKENLGFGTACNIGAKKSSQPMIMFLNPDTIIEVNTLSVMWNFFESHNDAGVAGCKIKNSDKFGIIGEIDSEVKENFKIRVPVVGFEIKLSGLIFD